MDQHDPPLQTWPWNGNPNKTGKGTEMRLILVWREEIRLTSNHLLCTTPCYCIDRQVVVAENIVTSLAICATCVHVSTYSFGSLVHGTWPLVCLSSKVVSKWYLYDLSVNLFESWTLWKTIDPLLAEVAVPRVVNGNKLLLCYKSCYFYAGIVNACHGGWWDTAGGIWESERSFPVCSWRISFDKSI